MEKLQLTCDLRNSPIGRLDLKWCYCFNSRLLSYLDNPVLHGIHWTCEVSQLPQGIRVPLGAHHILALARPPLGIRLKGHCSKTGRLVDGIGPHGCPGVHGGWHHGEGVIWKHALALRSHDHIHEGLQQSRFFHRPGTPVLQVSVESLSCNMFLSLECFCKTSQTNTSALFRSMTCQKQLQSLWRYK